MANGLITAQTARDIERRGRAAVTVSFTEPDGSESSFTQYFEDRENAAELHDRILDLLPCSDCLHDPCGCPNV